MKCKKRCNNHIRGCKEFLGNDDKYCLKCRVYRRSKEKELRDLKKNKAIDFNKNSFDKKMCYKCNKIDFKEKFVNQKCNKCYEQMQKTEDNRKSKNPYKEKFQNYKKSAKKRNINFLLQEKDFLNLVLQNCYYCNKKSDSSIPNGIDRIDSSKGYNLDNCVPCCKYCNIIKGNKSLEQFKIAVKQILSNNNLINDKININDLSFFKKREFPSYDRFVEELRNRKLKNFLTTKDYYNIIINKCNYCGLFPEGSNGIDRLDSSKSYFKQNCVSCCWTCNMMKNTNTSDDFIKDILKIYNFYINKIKTNIEITLEEKIQRELCNINSKFKKLGIDKFLYPDDYYYDKIWNGSFDEYLKIDPKIIFCESKEDKDIWMFYRRNISSFKLFNKNQYKGRQIFILVQDNFSKKYLGIIGITEAYRNIKFRDNYIDWDFDTRNKKLNYIMNISTCVPLQPFGYNYAGGKLLVKLIFSEEVHSYIENKYKINLIGLETYGLFGKSNMYDGLKEIKYLGLTEGNSYYKIDTNLVKDCKYFLNKNGYNINTDNKFIILNRICELLKLPKDIIFRDNKKGIYFGYFNPKNYLFLTNKINNIINNDLTNYKNKFYEWKKIANNRYFFLKKYNKLKKIIPKNNNNKITKKIVANDKKQVNNLYKENVKIKIIEDNQKDILKNFIKDKKNNIKQKKDKKILPINFSMVYTNLKTHIYFDKKYNGKRYAYKRQLHSNDINKEMILLIQDIKLKYPNIPFKLPDEYDKPIKKTNPNFILPRGFTQITDKGLDYICFHKTIKQKRYYKKCRIINDLETEYYNLIKKIKVKYPELTDYLDSINLDNILPRNYSIMNTSNGDTYIIFQKTINGKKCISKIKFNDSNKKEKLKELEERVKNKFYSNAINL